ncbi:hypothetical protein D6C90_10297 [Aureobasidium pullulans]|uniref:Uncharacterized protein n=1 Tax=Aureobasidium pullulans TaxID=5580 RepID=A0A4S9SRC6_AURPU|nr:hypothetical protein D6C90_10297 [Aureobasidium pullulans]
MNNSSNTNNQQQQAHNGEGPRPSLAERQWCIWHHRWVRHTSEQCEWGVQQRALGHLPGQVLPPRPNRNRASNRAAQQPRRNRRADHRDSGLAEVMDTVRDLAGSRANSRIARRLTFNEQIAIQSAGITAVAGIATSIVSGGANRHNVSQDVLLRRFRDTVRSIVDRHASPRQAPNGRSGSTT